jgi:DNA-binding transcriptional MocR family regulator
MNSYEYQDAILASDLSANAKLTALAISYHYNWSKAMASFPSIATLVTRTSLSRATIYRAKNELISGGYLHSTRRFNDSNLYLPVIPAQSQTDTLGVSEGRTNNELNYEYNNEKDKDSNESLVIFNNLNQEEIWKVFG